MKPRIAKICVLVLSFLLGWWLRGTSMVETRTIETIPAVKTSVKARFTEGLGSSNNAHDLQTEEQKGKNMGVLRLEEKLVVRLTAGLIYPSGDIAKLPFHIMAFGLPPEKAKALNLKINAIHVKLKELEDANSTFTRKPNGDEYFTINSFPAEGDQLRAELDAAVSQAFNASTDDRGILFIDQLLAAENLFLGFGSEPKEISYEQINASGQSANSFTIRKPGSQSADGILSSSPFGDSLLKTRFGYLLRKRTDVTVK